MEEVCAGDSLESCQAGVSRGKSDPPLVTPKSHDKREFESTKRRPTKHLAAPIQFAAGKTCRELDWVHFHGLLESILSLFAIIGMERNAFKAGGRFLHRFLAARHNCLWL